MKFILIINWNSKNIKNIYSKISKIDKYKNLYNPDLHKKYILDFYNNMFEMSYNYSIKSFQLKYALELNLFI